MSQLRLSRDKQRIDDKRRHTASSVFPVMKGHEDGGNVLWNERRTSQTSWAQYAQILRKEVIQPQVPLRLPCYDFTPVADPTVVACLPCGLAQRLRVKPTPMV